MRHDILPRALGALLLVGIGACSGGAQQPSPGSEPGNQAAAATEKVALAEALVHAKTVEGLTESIEDATLVAKTAPRHRSGSVTSGVQAPVNRTADLLGSRGGAVRHLDNGTLKSAPKFGAEP